MLESAKWIRATSEIGEMSPEFRKSLTVAKTVKKATVTVTAMGVYDLLLNAKKVGDAVMAPGWTSYHNRILVQTYDVTEALCAGENTLSIVGGKGWAVGYIGHKDTHHEWADHISVIARLDVEYEDGTTLVVNTDETWDVYSTQILDSELYHGETWDKTAPVTCLGKAIVDEAPKGELIGEVGERIRERERVAALRYIVTPKGERVIDFGQNLAGYVELRIQAPKGSRVVLTHAEVLDAEGNFYTENLRSAKNRNEYVCSGGEDVFKPHFCFQGYRYIRLDEYPFEEVDLSAFTSVAIYSDMKRTGYFACGNEKINQLYSNILWGQRSNFVDVPTDCPQRDERLGWTGDAQVFCRTASINYDTHEFFRKWLGDMMLEQTPEGLVWGIVPMVDTCGQRRSAAWADAATICPWEIYLAYGDKELLRTHYPMMKKWVEYMHNDGDEEFLWLGSRHYGDWLAMDAGDGIYMGATQTDFLGSAFFAYSTQLCIRAGKVLGEDTTYHENLLANVKREFRRAFMKDGLPVVYPKYDAFATDRPVKGLTQTAIVLILHFGLYEGEAEKKLLADTLVRLIRENGDRMTTGFVGTPYILHVLSECGYTDVAYTLLFQDKNPSWLFSVNHGATTMWEHWDSLKDDGTFWSTKMNSFNHYAYGAVYDWIFGVSAGIKVCDDGAGYRHVTVAPHPDRRLGFVRSAIETKFGRLCVEWRYNGDELRYMLSIPEGITADVTLPSGKKATVTAGEHLFVELA